MCEKVSDELISSQWKSRTAAETLEWTLSLHRWEYNEIVEFLTIKLLVHKNIVRTGRRPDLNEQSGLRIWVYFSSCVRKNVGTVGLQSERRLVSASLQLMPTCRRLFWAPEQTLRKSLCTILLQRSVSSWRPPVRPSRRSWSRPRLEGVQKL